MSYHGCLFSTALGRCGIAWSEDGVRAVQLPESSDRTLQRRLRAKASPLQLSTEPDDAEVRRLIARIQEHLEGEHQDFRDVTLDLADVAPFTRKVYSTARQVGPGQTVSYGGLARRCGKPGAAQAVGQAMAHNPIPIIIPCHRVLATDGGLGGFSAHGGKSTKLRMLTVEGAILEEVANAGVKALRRDRRLRPVIDSVGVMGFSDATSTDPFTTLTASIIHQQVSLKAGAAIYRRLISIVGDPPTPERLQRQSPGELRGAGVSARKASYLHDLSRQVLDRSLPLERLKRQDDEAVVRQLTRVKGIGRWSAEMYLIFHLGRLDVLPVDDQGLRRAVQLVYHLRSLPNAVRLRRLGKSWEPFRSIACRYLWRGLDSGGLV